LHFINVTNPELASFAIGLPNDITCWHFPKGGSLSQSEKLHTVLIISKARCDDVYVTTEWEIMLLKIPEAMKRRKAARKAWRARQ